MKSSANSPAALTLLPHEVAARCLHLPEPVFFDSATGGGDAISLVAADPGEIVSGSSEADWDLLREKVRARQGAASGQTSAPLGMAAGYVEYDGYFRFAFYNEMLIYRHADRAWIEVGNLSVRLRESPPARAENGPRFAATMDRASFCRLVRRAQEYIAAGDIYQVNLSHQFRADWSGETWPFYDSLRRNSPAPHAAFLRCDGRTILSTSPECFLKMSGRHIRTRPIKGTRPRGSDAAGDEEAARDLMTSAKEAAELVMITDLERNDLGQVCAYGSVTVREFLKLERFQQMFHSVSTIEGQLRPEVDHVTALKRCFPGGSITGAPKKRAREIIAELEPIPRGLYTGAIGYFGDNGESQFSIAIRTVVVENGVAHFHVGAGIVADSVAEHEYEETLTKAAGILLAAEKMPLVR